MAFMYRYLGELKGCMSLLILRCASAWKASHGMLVDVMHILGIPLLTCADLSRIWSGGRYVGLPFAVLKISPKYILQREILGSIVSCPLKAHSIFHDFEYQANVVTLVVCTAENVLCYLLAFWVKGCSIRNTNKHISGDWCHVNMAKRGPGWHCRRAMSERVRALCATVGR